MAKRGILDGMTAVEAVRRTIEDIDRPRLRLIAAACGVSEVTVYQWGETNEHGEPRQKIPACKVRLFCEAADNWLVLEALCWESGFVPSPLPETERAQEPVPQPTVMAQATAMLNALAQSFADGLFDEGEQREVAEAIRAFLNALENTETNIHQFRRAETLAAAERVDNG